MKRFDTSDQKIMGVVHAEIELVNSGDIAIAKRGIIRPEEVRRIKVNALVDSGAYMLAINENIQQQLGLDKIGEQTARYADESLHTLDEVGPVEVIFGNRSTSTRAFVLPGDAEVLLGAIPMEALDVIIDPRDQKMKVHPDRPYIAGTLLK